MPRIASTMLQPTPSEGLEVRNGGGCIALFGLPFLGAGLAGFGKAVEQVVEAAPDLDLESLLLLPFTLIFVAAGLTLILIRWGTTIEPATGIGASWWSVGPVGRRAEMPLASFSRVFLDEDSSGESVSWKVSLDGPAVKELVIVNSGSSMEARRVAEQVAEKLALPLSDRSHGAEVVRQPGTLDEPLVERLRRTNAFPATLPPARLRSRVTAAAGEVRIELGSARFTGRLVLELGCLGLFLVLAGPIGIELIQGLLPGPWAAIAITGLAALILLPPLLKVLPGTGTTVHASPRALRVEVRSLLRRRAIEIPAEELEELVIPRAASLIDDGSQRGAPAASLREGVDSMNDPAPRWLKVAGGVARTKGITAIGDRTSISFGEGLPEEEQAYLVARIIAALAGRWA
jgi:hypothetical protein